MSSHREAPESSKDPVTDNTDTYAFVSPDRPDTVTIITNYIPLEDPAGGPNFFEFGDDVLYEINIDNDGDGKPDVTYEFRFTTTVVNPDSFLYNTGPIDALDSPNFNRRQSYTVTEVRNRRRRTLAKDLPSPPCNVGLRSTPNYAALANAAIFDVGNGIRVFAGQRLDGFYVDLGSIFDLAALRPFQNLHLIPTPQAPGINALRSFNVHTIAIQVPIDRLTSNGKRPTDPMSPKATIGVYGRGVPAEGPLPGRRLRLPASVRSAWCRGSGCRCSTRSSCRWAARTSGTASRRTAIPSSPSTWPGRSSASCCRSCTPACSRTWPPSTPRWPTGPTCWRSSSPGSRPGPSRGSRTSPGQTQADLLRLNVAIPPSAHPNVNGILGGDLAGFPNGRRVFDDIVTVELQAVAGLTIPLVDKTFTPDGPAKLINDGTQVLGDVTFLDTFPYLDHPVSGYDVLPLSVP